MRSHMVLDSVRSAGTAERTGQWHTAAVHNVTAIVGAGVLGLPYAMAGLTWSGGVIVLVLSWTTSLYTLWQVLAVSPAPRNTSPRYLNSWRCVSGWHLTLLVSSGAQLCAMHEMDGLRFNRYHELGQVSRTHDHAVAAAITASCVPVQFCAAPLS
jgi:hypothetical protein